MRRLLLIAAAFSLAACCRGAWCYTPVQASKKVGVPPPAPSQPADSSTNVDPRTMGPRSD
jgi:hypothetical protein